MTGMFSPAWGPSALQAVRPLPWAGRGRAGRRPPPQLAGAAHSQPGPDAKRSLASDSCTSQAACAAVGTYVNGAGKAVTLAEVEWRELAGPGHR